MRIAARRLVLCFLFCVGLGCWAAGASQAFPEPEVSVPSSLGAGLVVAGVQVLDEGQQVLAQREAMLASPFAVAERAASRTKFSGLSTEQAAKLAGDVFPKLINRPAGGLPVLAEVSRVAAFPSDHAASVLLSDGKHALVESLEPIAIKSSSGRRVPIDLGLSKAGEAFRPVSPLVPVRIPSRVGSGVLLAETGVSLTPVGPSGAALGGSEGVVDGASVLYANTQIDTDTLIKPTTLGFEAGALLRSALSPHRLFYRLAMPSGARLVPDAHTGVVRVLDRGRRLATILAPSAMDANGTAVPVKMTVSGDIVTMAVHESASYEHPIIVDPEIIRDANLTIHTKGNPSNWVFETTNSAEWQQEVGSSITISPKGSYKGNEGAVLNYSTQGESRIYKVSFEVAGTIEGDPIEAYMHVDDPVIESAQGWLSKNYSVSGSLRGYCAHNCALEEIEDGRPGNSVDYGLATSGSGSAGTISISSATVNIAQEKGPEISVNTTTSNLGARRNVLYGSGWWLGPHSNGAFEVKAHDPGIGISHYVVENTGKSWVETHAYLANGECGGVECEPTHDPIYEYNSKLPDGEGHLAGSVEDAMELKSALAGSPVLKVDSTPPHSISISGLPTGNEIGEGEYVLKAEATDGNGTVPSSGVGSIAIAVDGREVGKPNGSCPLGTCTAKGEWTINGGEFGAGEHKLTVTATDPAGNSASETFVLKVHHASPVALGPGTVDPQSGEFSMQAGNVSIGAPGGSLNVGRTYRSRHVTAGGEGPLGPQWSLSVGGEESISRVLNGNPTLTAANGTQTTFTSVGEGKFTSPTGDSNLVLSETKNEKAEPEYLLKNAADGDTTRFTFPVQGGSVWKATKQEGPLAAQTVRYTYQTVEGTTEPLEAVAPEPAGVSCGKEIKELKAGCRALGFVYAHETTAKGEKPSEWNAYKGRLKEILYYAYNTAAKEVKPIVVAEYAYDAKGRLRAEWNPQVSPTLKTTYGYDSEGHVTAVNAAGEEPWLLHYGTDAVDASTGRLLSVIRPAASTPTELKAQDEESPPENTKVPTLSSTKPVVGTKISVSSEGTWSNAPNAYAYQWERCNEAGAECAPIPGAVNQSYYPVTADQGREIAAQVIALNPDGATAAVSAATSGVAPGTPNSPAPEPPAVGTSSVWTVEYGVPLSGSEELHTMTKAEVAKWGQTDVPVEATAIYPPDKPMGWPAKAYERATVQYLDSDGRTVNVASPTGGVSTTEYNTLNDVIRSLSPDNRAAALKESCLSEGSCKSAELSKLLDTENTYEETGSEPGTKLLSTLGPQHNVELTNGSQVEARAHTVDSHDEGAPTEGGPYDLVTKSTQGAVVAGKEEPESVRTTITSYTGAGSQEGLGWKLRKPISVTTDPTSANPNGLNLVHTTEYEPNTGEPVETKVPAVAGKDKRVPPTYAAAFGTKGTGAGQLETPTYDAIDAKGNVWVAEYGSNRISEFSSTGTFIETVGWGVSNGESKLEVCTSSCKEGIAGTGKGQLSAPTGIAIAGGFVYVVDSGNNRIEVLNEKGEWANQWGATGAGASQFKTPLAIAISPSGNVWVGDSLNRRLQEFKSSGTFIEAVGWGVSNGKSEYEVCTSSCQTGIKGSGIGEFASTWGMAFAGSTLYVTDTGNSRVQEINEKSEPAGQFGSAGTGNGQLESPIGIATSPTTGFLYVTDTGNNRMQVFTPSGEYLTQFASFGTGNGQLDFPEGNAVNSSGEVYVVDDLNHRVEKWVPTITGNEGAHDTKTVYYSAKEEAEVPACRNHPEWAGLPCQTGPVAQPGTSGLPELPVASTTAYNVWDEPLTTVETVGASTRTKTYTYEASGRLEKESTTSSVGTALPTVTDKYTAEAGAEIGALTTQSTTVEGKTKKLTSVFNTLGQLTSYTDADENTSTYEYDVDGRIHKTNDGKGTQTYTYSKTTGLTEELVDSSHEGMKFTASYDVEGNTLTEGYPNGMTAYYTYNQTGTPTSLIYKKLTNCTEEEKEKCKWFKDAIIPSIHGQWLTQTSNLSKQEYIYDAAGRLTQVQNTPAGKGCTTRIYAYDEDSNRTSLTTREPNLKKECTTTGGSIESHTYDTADRLTDSGTAYNTFGDITTLPSADAEGQALTNTYYVDGQAASQTQSEQTIGYNLDPAGRTRETVATGKKVSDVVSHYAGPGDSPSWTTNTTSETVRNIPGINGQLAAIQNNSETPVLDLANLHGDIIGTAYLSETATELASKADTSEFGVPTTTLPAKYSWLGAIELPTELASGVMTMGARSYVPQLGRFLQPDPVPGGSANAYSYTFGDPVNSTDPSGDYTFVASYVAQADAEWAAGAEGREAGRIEAARLAAEWAAQEAAARAAAEYAYELAVWEAEWAAGPQYGEEWEEWGEEEGEYEYVANHQGSENGKQEAHIEPAILVQPLTSEAGEGGSGPPSRVPLCVTGSDANCALDAGGHAGSCHRSQNKCKKAKSKHSTVPEGNACVGGGTAAAIIGPFAPAVAGTIVGVGLAVGC